MEIRVPQTGGWTALHLMNAAWGHIGVIAKRAYAVANGAATPAAPQEIIVTDTVDPAATDGEDFPVIRREAETALFKAQGDVLFLGRGTEAADSSGAQITSASLRVAGAQRRRYTRQPDAADPVNLFGYEPRTKRVPGYDPDTFSFAASGAALFRSARRSAGFSVPVSTLLPTGSAQVEVTTQSAGTTDTLTAFEITMPPLTATPFVWEGGTNTPSNWCKRAPLQLVPDTMTIEGDLVSVLWRGKLALSAVPAADLRRLKIEEAA
ncbi:MAG: hypothetical protein AAGM84_01650 [Pseudomonadota bacterium]